MSQASISQNNFTSDINGYLSCYMESRQCENKDNVYQELADKEKDLALAAQLGQALLEANENLRVENEDMLEKFQQKIYEMENEKALLKRRLETAESDYEMQLQALQKDVVNLRRELTVQKCDKTEKLQEKEEELSEIEQKQDVIQGELIESRNENRYLRERMNDMERRVCDERMAMQDHVQQLDQLKCEILQLRKDKRRLELEIRRISEERDQLVSQLEEAQNSQDHLERTNEQNRIKIERQQQEIQNLQEAATFIQNSLEHKTDNKNEYNNNNNSKNRPNELWWQIWIDGNNYPNNYSNNSNSNYGAGDEDVEMDDESVLVSAAINGNSILMPTRNTLETLEGNICDSDGIEGDEDEEEEPEFIKQLKAEVVEVYSQLRCICADLSFHRSMSCVGVGGQTGAGAGGGGGGGGGGCNNNENVPSTPDELALVEMDFKLGSLRSALSELRGLLNDLTYVYDTESFDHQQSQHRNNGQLLETKKKQLHQLNLELVSCDDRLQTLGDQIEKENNTKLPNETTQMRTKLMDKRNDVAKRMSRTQSEMEMLACDPGKVDLTSWGRWPGWLDCDVDREDYEEEFEVD